MDDIQTYQTDTLEPQVESSIAQELNTETTALTSEIPQVDAAPSTANDDIVNADLRQRQYIAKSQVCDNVGTVAPVSLLYDMNRTLTELDRKVRGVDNYVMAKLGYNNLIELCCRLYQTSRFLYSHY